jgi:hypothetical protein
MVLSASILSGALLYPESRLVAAAPLAVGVAVLLLLYRSLRRSRGFRAQPQFTRQAMREQSDGEAGDTFDIGEE